MRGEISQKHPDQVRLKANTLATVTWSSPGETDQDAGLLLYLYDKIWPPNPVVLIRSKKGAALLRGPLDFARTEALRADFHPFCLSAADIDLDAPKVNEPAPSCMTVRVAYSVSRAGASSAAVAKL
jgi:hypothetical protein